MLHHGRQIDRKGLRKLTDGCAGLALKLREDRAARRVNECGKGAVEAFYYSSPYVKVLLHAPTLSTVCGMMIRNAALVPIFPLRLDLSYPLFLRRASFAEGD